MKCPICKGKGELKQREISFTEAIIKTLYKNGFSMGKISKITGFSKTTVFYWIHK